MITKTILLPIIVAGFGLSIPHPATGQVSTENGAPLEVIARNGADKEKHLSSIGGVVPMLMVRPNQTVPVTLQFPGDKAGTPVVAMPLDGGEVSGGRLVVLPTGRVVFTFKPVPVPGRYRLVVRTPAEEHLLEFYVVDPAHPPQHRSRGQ